MKANLFPTLACLIMGISLPSLSAADKAAPKDTTVVIAEGVGINADKALLNALRNAVQQVVGVIVDAETRIKNDKLVKDQILDFSNGFVEKFEKLKEGKNDDVLYEVTIKATVKRRQLYDRLKKTKVIASAKVDGGSLFGEAMSKNEAEKKGAKLLQKALLDLELPGSLLSTEILNQKPEIIGRGRDSIKARWRVRVKFDLDKYKKTVFPKLKQVLSDICIKKIVEEKFSSRQTEVRENAVVIRLLEVNGKEIFHRFLVDKEIALIFRGYQAGTLGTNVNSSTPADRYKRTQEPCGQLNISLLDSEGKSLKQAKVKMDVNMLFPPSQEARRYVDIRVYLIGLFIYGNHRFTTDSVEGDRLEGAYSIIPYFYHGDQRPIAWDPKRSSQYCDHVWTPTLRLEDVKNAAKLTAEIKLK